MKEYPPPTMDLRTKGSETEVSTFRPRETVTLQAPSLERFMYIQRWAKNCSVFFKNRSLGHAGEFKYRVYQRSPKRFVQFPSRNLMLSLLT